MRQRETVCAFFVLMAIGAASQCVQAMNVSVNCDKKGTITKALKLLASANPLGPNKITVSGGCNENLVIQSYGSPDPDYREWSFHHRQLRRELSRR